jgi:hypothetical protein
MKLPVLDTYAFPITLPSSGQTINLRPFLVREEKLLLMAQESTNYDDHIEAVSQIIKNCSNDTVNPRRVPYFDIEYLLLQLRARSVGEITTSIYVCHNKPNGDDIECGHRTPVNINLIDIPVEGINTDPEAFVLKLSDKYTLHLKYPTVYTIHHLVLAAQNDGQIGTQPFLTALCDVFDTLENIETHESYNFADYTTDEKLEFLESLSPRNYAELIRFLDTLPTVEKSVTFTCEKCHFQHTLLLSGVTDFLD